MLANIKRHLYPCFVSHRECLNIYFLLVLTPSLSRSVAAALYGYRYLGLQILDAGRLDSRRRTLDRTSHRSRSPRARTRSTCPCSESLKTDRLVSGRCQKGILVSPLIRRRADYPIPSLSKLSDLSSVILPMQSPASRMGIMSRPSVHLTSCSPMVSRPTITIIFSC